MRSQITWKNVLFAIVAIAIAGVVAVGWGLSEMQTTGSSTIVVGTHITSILGR